MRKLLQAGIILLGASGICFLAVCSDDPCKLIVASWTIFNLTLECLLA